MRVDEGGVTVIVDFKEKGRSCVCYVCVQDLVFHYTYEKTDTLFDNLK